jgi:spore germination protein YaaH
MMRRIPALAVLMLAVFAFGYSMKEKRSQNIRWGYIAHYSLLQGAKIDDILKRAENYTHLGITGFPADKNGNIYTPIPSNTLNMVITSLQKMDKVIIPVISVKSVKDGKQLLNSESAQKGIIRSIQRIQNQMHTTHVQFDFEYLPPSMVDKYGSFLKNVRSGLNESSISAAIFPQVDFPEKWAKFHDLSVIGPYLDYIVLMCYDLHRKGTGAGPVVTEEWARDNIKKALTHMNSDDILLGIPSYGYRWCQEGQKKKVTAISARYASRLGRQYGFVRHPSGNLHVAYDNCMVYASDDHMINSLQKLADKYELAGTALWRIGFEE